MKKLFLFLLIIISATAIAQPNPTPLTKWNSNGRTVDNYYTPESNRLDSFLMNGGIPIEGSITVGTVVGTFNPNDTGTHRRIDTTNARLTKINTTLVQSNTSLQTVVSNTTSIKNNTDSINYYLNNGLYNPNNSDWYLDEVQLYLLNLISFYTLTGSAPQNNSVLANGLYDYVNTDWYLNEITQVNKSTEAAVGRVEHLDSIGNKKTDSVNFKLDSANNVSVSSNGFLNSLSTATGILLEYNATTGSGNFAPYSSTGLLSRGLYDYTTSKYFLREINIYDSTQNRKIDSLNFKLDSISQYTTTGNVNAHTISALGTFVIPANSILIGGFTTLSQAKLTTTDISGETTYEAGYIIGSIPANVPLQAFHGSTSHTITAVNACVIFIVPLN